MSRCQSLVFPGAIPFLIVARMIRTTSGGSFPDKDIHVWGMKDLIRLLADASIVPNSMIRWDRKIDTDYLIE